MVNNKTLNKLALILNENKINWGIGGSYLLYLHKLYFTPNDLDVWIHPKDMKKVKKLFNTFEKIKTNIQLPEEFHLKIKFFEIEVDFVSCFIVTPNQHTFSYHISPNTIEIFKLDDGNDIPCTSLEDWYVIYKLLHREEKAGLIEKVFVEKHIPLSDKMLRASMSRIDNTIQKRIKKDVDKLIFNSIQYSLWDLDYLKGGENKDDQ